MTTKEMLFMGLVAAFIAFCLFMGIRSSKTHRSASDKPFVVGQVNNWELPHLEDDLKAAERDHADCVWAEARGKKNDPHWFDIVCHTTAKPHYK